MIAVKMISKCPKRFSMKSVAVFIALFHASLMMATVPACQTFSSAIVEAASPEPDQLPPIPPLESPNQAPEDGVFDVTEHGAVSDGGTESSSVCDLSLIIIYFFYFFFKF